MTVENIKKARAEVERFLVCVDKVLEESVSEYTGVVHEGTWSVLDTGKNTGALRRASLDLTRSLAEMRKPWNPLIPSAT